jgi:hypothetical protein
MAEEVMHKTNDKNEECAQDIKGRAVYNIA